MEGRAVIRVGDTFLHVVAGDDAKHAGQLLAPRSLSIDLMRPCATVLRKIFAYSMPGRRMLWTYSARPVTLARPSRRGTERPTCADLGVEGLSVAAISALRPSVHAPARGPRADVDAHQFALVGRRAAHVGDDLALPPPRPRRPRRSSLSSTLAPLSSGFRRCEPHRLFGRGADHDARAILIACRRRRATTATPSAGQSSAEPVVTLI